MRRARTGIVTALAIAALASVAGGEAIAQPYPNRAVRIIVPFTPGGTTDILARLAGQHLSDRLGQPFVIENRPGAGTAVGANAVAKADPDGYTLLLGTSTPLAINATLHKNLAYNPATDLIPVSMMAASPLALVVHPDVPAKSLAELIALAKSKPDELQFGSGGPGAPHHLFMELLAKMAGFKAKHVPYRGTVPALNDVVGGHITMMFSDLPPVLDLAKSGKVRALAISSKERSPALPDVPTIAEAGVPGYDAVAWLCLAGPAAMPADVTSKLFGEMKAVLALPAVSGQLSQLGLLPMANDSPAQLKQFMLDEIARWAPVVRASGASVE